MPYLLKVHVLELEILLIKEKVSYLSCISTGDGIHQVCTTKECICPLDCMCKRGFFIKFMCKNLFTDTQWHCYRGLEDIPLVSYRVDFLIHQNSRRRFQKCDKRPLARFHCFTFISLILITLSSCSFIACCCCCSSLQ